MDDKNEALCIGIDLGTSRSSISASNGERHVVDSYVGWPLDMVARKLTKKTVFIGHEALENRSMLDLRRPLERGVIKEGSEKDAQAVQEILRHLISLIGIKQKSKNRPKIRAVVGVYIGFGLMTAGTTLGENTRPATAITMIRNGASEKME